MKKNALSLLLCCLLAVPFESMKADTVMEGQSTEGKDFWVTFMRADQNDHSDASDKAVTLALTVSAKEECDVTFTNPNTGETATRHLAAGSIEEIAFYTGDAGENARTRTDAQKATVTCYTYYPDSADNSGVHVEATAPISLFASNRRSKSFDATNVLPTASLLDEYLIQAIAPSDHGDEPQGTHFAIIATTDDVVVDYCPTVETMAVRSAKSAYAFSGGIGMSDEDIRLANFKIGDTLHTPALKKGQVYYVWTGNYNGAAADLSGTWLKARDGKKIAVFQGAPHTNLPDKIRDRDHLFSQAMPVAYWGNTFVITASMTRGRDIIRVMAREDGTELHIKYTLPDGSVKDSLAHVFNFASDPKRTFEFEIGKKGVQCTDKNHKGTLPDPLVEGESCLITSSCPCATHLFMVSNTYDDNSKGDPAMVWVNPIEQRINDITFATYGSSNTHYVNIVTDKAGVANMMLDGNNIAADFKPVSGSNDAWYYARKDISYDTHHLTGTTGFIAHVYGYGDKESYGYSAGGATKPLTQFITINGQIFSPDTKNTLCSEDTIKFACHPDYEFEKMEWFFGDGDSRTVTREQSEDSDSIVPHYYKNSGVYDAYVLIYRQSSNLCEGQNAVDRIPITVTIGRYEFKVTDVDIPCKVEGQEWFGKIFYSDGGSHINLTGDDVSITFNEEAKEAGFRDEELVIRDGYFQITIHDNGLFRTETLYGINLKITSECGGIDTTLNFSRDFDNEVIKQRYNNVLALDSTMQNYILSDFQWYRVSDSTAVDGQVSATLNFYDLPESEYNKDEEYYVCFIVNKGTPEEVRKCVCAKSFSSPQTTEHRFDANPEGLVISATQTIAGDRIFVNADWNGKTGQDEDYCYAQWIDAGGHVYATYKGIPDGGCTIPTPAVTEPTLYLLRVVTGRGSRSFKFIIQ